MRLILIHLEDLGLREFMLQEIASDVQARRIYPSERLNSFGLQQFPLLLKHAAERYNDVWLTGELHPGYFLSHETRHTKRGPVRVRVPENAADVLAEAECNRLYLRALCLLAEAKEIRCLVIYRAKAVSHSRPESEMKINTYVEVDRLLNDLRTNIGVDTALGLALTGSGLSARLS